jgi:site-specific recombinase XerD
MASNNNWDKKFFVLRDRDGDLSKPWYVEHYVDGRRKQTKGQINNGVTAEQRRLLAQQLIDELKLRYPPPPPNHKIRSNLFEALDALAPYLSDRTVQDYRSQLKQLFDYFGNGKVTVAALRKYFEQYRRSHAQTTTYDHRRKLKRMFDKAEYGHLLQSIKIEKGKHQPARYFQPAQDKMIMDHIRQKDWMFYLYCGFTRYLAIRPRAETRFLKVADIFFEEKKVCLRGEVTKTDENQYVRIPAHFLEELKTIQHEPPSSYIFTSIKYDNLFKPVSRNHYGNLFRDVLIEFGFDPNDYGLYSLKHTLAAGFIYSGGSMFQLMHHFRHKDIKTTQLYLRQLGLEVLDDFIDKIPSPGEWGSEYSKRIINVV